MPIHKVKLPQTAAEFETSVNTTSLLTKRWISIHLVYKAK